MSDQQDLLNQPDATGERTIETQTIETQTTETEATEKKTTDASMIVRPTDPQSK